jgi:hypothetical protein
MIREAHQLIWWVFFIMEVFVKIVVLGYNPWISAAGTCFPRGGPGASSALKAPAGSPVTSLSRRSQVPSATIHSSLVFKFVSIGFNKNSYCNHT